MKRKKRQAAHPEKWWTKGITSMNVGERLRIVPWWESHDRSGERINVIIDPGPAFGLGDHPSTVMALELLEIAMDKTGNSKEGPSVLDVGTGAGTLAIAAKSLGAGFTVALDIDLVSIFSISKNNIELNRGNWDENNSAPLCLFVGELAVSGAFDIVLANLAAPVLLRLRENLASVAKSLLILSGIADEMVGEVEQAFSVAMHNLVHKRQSGWNAMLLSKGLESRAVL